MTIGIVSYFNPFEILPFLYGDQQVPNVNKGASAVNLLVKELLEQGHNVIVFTTYPYKGGTITLTGKNVTIYMVSTQHTIPKTSLFHILIVIRRLIKLIKQRINEIDVLHAHWTYEFALAAKHFAQRKPVFCTVRDWCPYIYSYQKRFRSRLGWKVKYHMFRKVMKGDSIHFIANSTYTYNRIKSEYPQKEVPIIPNPIDKNYILKERKKYPDNEIFISIAAGIDKRKNIGNLIAAFHLYHNEHPESTLMLVGGDFVDNNQHIIQWKEKGLLGGVKLCGWVDHSQLMPLLDSVSALVHPSLEETFGNILLEGMARRIPVIGGDKSGAVPEVLGNGKYGILCNVSDVQDIYRSLCKIHDKKYIQNIINNATEYIISTYQSDIIARKHISLYQSFT